MTTQPVTIRYADFNRFWDEVLGTDYYYEDHDVPELDTDFPEAIDPNLMLTLAAFWAQWQQDPSDGFVPSPGDDDYRDRHPFLTRREAADRVLDIVPILRRWQAGDTSRTFAVTIPADQADALATFVASIGGTVQS